MKRQPSEWEKIFANEDIADKELLFKIYKELLKLHSKTMYSTFKKWAKVLNRYPTKEDIQMANKHLERCSTSYVIKEL